MALINGKRAGTKTISEALKLAFIIRDKSKKNKNKNGCITKFLSKSLEKKKKLQICKKINEKLCPRAVNKVSDEIIFSSKYGRINSTSKETDIFQTRKVN